MVGKEIPLSFIEVFPLHLIMLTAEVERLFVGILWAIEGKSGIWRLGQDLHGLVFAPVPCLSARSIDVTVFDTSQAFNVIFFGPTRCPDAPIAELEYGNQFSSLLLPRCNDLFPGEKEVLARLLVGFSVCNRYLC